MRLTEAFGIALAVTALAAAPAFACGGRQVSDSGRLTIATGPEPVTPQTPIPAPADD
jgi:hypothetical protein